MGLAYELLIRRSQVRVLPGVPYFFFRNNEICRISLLPKVILCNKSSVARLLRTASLKTTSNAAGFRECSWPLQWMKASVWMCMLPTPTPEGSGSPSERDAIEAINSSTTNHQRFWIFVRCRFPLDWKRHRSSDNKQKTFHRLY